MERTKASIGVAAALLGIATVAHAQYIRPAYSYPVPATGGTEVGDTPLFFTPFVGVAAGHDTNLFLTPSNETASNFWVFNPGFKLDARRPGMVLQSDYQAQIGRYTSSSNDDYVDQTWHNTLDTAFNQRTFLRLGYDYILGHDPRGSTDRPFGTHPDRYKISDPFGTFAFGAPGAQGRIELYGASLHKEYLNNKEFTSTSDRIENQGGGAFYWRVAPKTYALFEARTTNIHYDISSPLSAQEHRYYVGLSWDATAATSGTIKVGTLRRDFDGSLPDESFSSWEGLVTWAPRTYSKFDFFTSRQTSESTGLGNFILTSVGGVAWTHEWSSYLQSGVNLKYQRDAYQGFDRTDNTKSVGLKVGYRFRPWLTLGAEYNYFKRDSNLNTFDYDRSIYLLTATASM